MVTSKNKLSYENGLRALDQQSLHYNQYKGYMIKICINGTYKLTIPHDSCLEIYTGRTTRGTA